MRSPVYRNLDQPFEIWGFSTGQMTLLCCSLVAGGELAELIGVHRVWSLLLTICLAIVIYGIRKSFGRLFAQRLYRFARLPQRTRERLVPHGRLR